MLKFYGLENEYLQAKMRAAKYEIRDKKFSNYFMDIHDTTFDFNQDVNTILREVQNLKSYDSYFEETVEGLNKIGTNINILHILNPVNIDKFMLHLLRLLELRQDIEATTERVQESLENLKKYKTGLVEILEKITALFNYHESQNEVLKKK